MFMTREVFVGSSTEALKNAKQICELLTRDSDTRAVEWTEVFQPGFLTFEALEAMLLRCCGAVFVATPDDQTIIRGHTVNSPRANIMLEFGLVAGRMGRYNIALCQYGDVDLPTDLKGLTIIPMDAPADAPDPNQHKQMAEQSLSLWASRLVSTTDQVARTEIVHGYTGRWDFALQLKKWRDLDVPAGGYVQVNGYLDLLMPPSGQTGRGLAHATILFRLPDSNGKHVYQGEYRTAHEITNALCKRDGSLELTVEAFALQRVATAGSAPAQLDGIEIQREPWSARWHVSPCAEPRTLTGFVNTEGSISSHGTAKMVKRSET